MRVERLDDTGVASDWVCQFWHIAAVEANRASEWPIFLYFFYRIMQGCRSHCVIGVDVTRVCTCQYDGEQSTGLRQADPGYSTSEGACRSGRRPSPRVLSCRFNLCEMRSASVAVSRDLLWFGSTSPLSRKSARSPETAVHS